MSNKSQQKLTKTMTNNLTKQCQQKHNKKAYQNN